MTTYVTAGAAQTEPWDIRSGATAQVLAKIEQAAAAVSYERGFVGDVRRLPQFLVAEVDSAPALLRLAEDLSHVRLLI